MKRIFVAIDISEEIKARISNYVESLRQDFIHLRIGWVKVENLHLTLKFIGDIDEKKIEKLSKTTQRISDRHESFDLNILNTGAFPNKKKARVLWLGVEDKSISLVKIKKDLEDELGKLGFEKEKRKFKPHLTIARLRENLKSKDLVNQHLLNKFKPAKFKVQNIVIYESELKLTGSVYKIVSSKKLN